MRAALGASVLSRSDPLLPSLFLLLCLTPPGPRLQASLQVSDKKTKNLAGVFDLPKPDVDVMTGKKQPKSGGGFSFPSFSFGTEASSSKPAVAPGPAEPSEGASPLLLAALVLFSPLLIVQAVQLQTLARIGSQALGLAEEAPATGTVKRVVKTSGAAPAAKASFFDKFSR